MTIRPVLHRVFRLAVIGFAAVLPGVSLHASAAAPAVPGAPSSTDADAGVIAYVKRSTQDIRLVSPDGTNDRVLWTEPEPPFVYPAYDLAWRPDGGELAFSSGHEEACSYFQSDVYAIGSDGTGYRRVTNGPACAELAGLPKGTVTVDVTVLTSSPVWVYVAGAPGIKAASSGTMTFDNVADLGSGVLQPSVGIDGLKRTLGYPPYADVQPGQTVAGGIVSISADSGIYRWGAGKVSWQADGSALSYAIRLCSEIDQMPAVPPYGSTGQPLPVVTDASPCLVAWNPIVAEQDEYLYYSTDNPLGLDVEGIYLNTVGNASGGTKLVDLDYFNGTQVFDIQWLPDGSGFLFSLQYVPLEIYSDIFEYDFATQQITQVTTLLDDSVREFSISPNGQQVVFERTTDPVFDPTSSLWIINRDGSALHMLVDDAGRPAWGPSAAPAVAPHVDIGLNGTNVVLGWTNNPINVGGYRVWYSEKPDFQPGDLGATPVDRPAGSTGWTHTGAAGSAAHNYYYLVQGLGAGGAVSGPSNRMGGFNFGLTRGTM